MILFVDECIRSKYVFKGHLNFFDNMFDASIAPLTLTPNCFAINIWLMVILSPQTTIWTHPSFVDSQVCKNSSNRFDYGTV
jgi:hypothetical protein